ncbi:GNAT family N-acetyltransferase [Candidatus Microgenomates bacterium]|nr:GNAT family N-acetyltransferase [Candidatus Microgenomates bacterium]MBI2622420.1 GNAT family N-acetyltransferase [Candidatus Microgenomates bacterium]
MKWENENFIGKVANPSNIEEASLVARWTQEAGTMLPKTPSQVLELFSQGHSVLVYDRATGELAGHTGITFTYGDGTVEIGALVTRADTRNRGAATFATQNIIELASVLYPGALKFALANQVSLHLYLRAGGKIMACSQLTDEVWQPCLSCPNLPKQELGQPFKCCDTPVELNHFQEQQ